MAEDMVAGVERLSASALREVRRQVDSPRRGVVAVFRGFDQVSRRRAAHLHRQLAPEVSSVIDVRPGSDLGRIVDVRDVTLLVDACSTPRPEARLLAHRLGLPFVSSTTDHT